jgi:Protein of unknown function (DUF2911)
MRMNKAYFMIGLAIALGLFFEFTAYADEADQETIITFSAPVEIPGKALPAGTYLFRLADHGSDPNVVQILNADGTKLYAMLPTIDTERAEPSGETTMTLAEQGAGKPDALRKWYYPGSQTGHEFLYSAREEKQLTQDQQQTIAAGPKTSHAEAQAGD